jgi:hypothetical protein
MIEQGSARRIGVADISFRGHVPRMSLRASSKARMSFERSKP